MSKRVIWMIASLMLAGLACTLLTGEQVAEDGEISVVINNPADNTQVEAGQEVMVQITINDPAGVVNRQELQVDGVAVATSEAVAPEGAPAFSIILPYTPEKSGTYTVTALAYGSDGSASEPVSITLQVTGDEEEDEDKDKDKDKDKDEDKDEEPAQPTPTTAPVPDARGCTNDMSYVADVTIPDGTVMDPGEAFTKTWTIRNTGTCDWGGYQLVFHSNNQMGGPSAITVPATNAGQNRDVSVNLTAPTAEGTHRSTWTMRSADGDLFGDRIFAEIKIEGEEEPPPSGDGPDLIIKTVKTSPSEPVADEVTTYEIKVKNQGNEAADESTVRGEFEGGGTATVTVPALDPDTSETVTLTQNIGETGEKTATFTADSGDDVKETDEENNEETFTFTYVAIYNSGTFTVRGTYRGDLDEGQESAGTTDFKWRMVNATERYIEPDNGATFAVMSGSVGYAECSAASLSGGDIDGSDPDYSDVPPGTWLCAETSDGRISAFKIDAIDTPDNHKMTLSFTTYE